MLFVLFVLVDLSIIFHSPPDGLTIKKADRELNQLILTKNSKRAVAYYSDDFILTTSSGTVKYKHDMVTEISSPELSLVINETSNVEIRIVGSTAILTGILHQAGSFRGKYSDNRFLITDTWVETSSGWKILARHASLQPSMKKVT
jgi:hypothetical protein